MQNVYPIGDTAAQTSGFASSKQPFSPCVVDCYLDECPVRLRSNSTHEKQKSSGEGLGSPRNPRNNKEQNNAMLDGMLRALLTDVKSSTSPVNQLSGCIFIIDSPEATQRPNSRPIPYNHMRKQPSHVERPAHNNWPIIQPMKNSP